MTRKYILKNVKFIHIYDIISDFWNLDKYFFQGLLDPHCKQHKECIWNNLKYSEYIYTLKTYEYCLLKHYKMDILDY